MKEILKKLEKLWVSVTFAEAGEHETSQNILADTTREERGVEVYQEA